MRIEPFDGANGGSLLGRVHSSTSMSPLQRPDRVNRVAEWVVVRFSTIFNWVLRRLYALEKAYYSCERNE